MQFSLKDKYTQLLISLVLVFGVVGLLPEEIGLFLLSALLLGACLLLVKTLTLKKRALYFYITLACLALISDFVYLMAVGNRVRSHLAIGADLIHAGFFIVSIIVITRKIFDEPRVTIDTIAGGVCVYLLIGNLWFLFYDNLNYIQTMAFRSPDDSVTTFDLFYFSFTTLTTVGYGDITPVSQLARVAANLESIVGVLFPAVSIARLVSMYETSRGSSPNPNTYNR